MRSLPWDAASLRQEPAVSFLSIWQHQTHVQLQGAKQAWRCPRKPLGAPVAGTSDPEVGGSLGRGGWGAGGRKDG